MANFSSNYVWVLSLDDGSIKIYKNLISLERDLPEAIRDKKLQKSLNKWVYGPGGKLEAAKYKVSGSSGIGKRKKKKL